MAQFCINHNDATYQALQKMTDLPDFELDMLVRPYLEETGELPSVDMILNEADTIPHLVKTYNLKKVDDFYVSENASELDQFELNKIYRDLEIEVTPLSNNRAMLKVKRRALLNRKLKSPLYQHVPLETTTFEEVQPIEKVGNEYIYKLNKYYYKTNYRISRPELLLKTKSFPSLSEARNGKIEYQKNYLNNTSVYAILNSKQLDFGYDIRVQNNGPMPPVLNFYRDFTYPEFEYNNYVAGEYEIIDNIININPDAVQNPKDLETILLKALGYSDENILSIVRQLKFLEQYETIDDGEGNYIIRKYSNYDIKNLNDSVDIPADPRDSIEHLLDRLEEVYGITFNRVTSEDLKNMELESIIPGITTARAFIYNGEIYINTDNANLASPIHELGHLILGTLRQTNPEVYFKLVETVEQLPNYQELVSHYINRTREDINEEIFVDQFAHNFLKELNIDDKLRKKAEYEIKRNIDSAIFPNTSTTTVSLQDLTNKSFNEIMQIFGTIVNKDTLADVFNGEEGFKTRFTANLKQQLLENGSLTEYCI